MYTDLHCIQLDDNDNIRMMNWTNIGINWSPKSINTRIKRTPFLKNVLLAKENCLEQASGAVRTKHEVITGEFEITGNDHFDDNTAYTKDLYKAK